MKATIWLIYISSIVILCVQADLQDNDHIEICSKCADAVLPRCKSANDERLDKQVDCPSKGCVIGLDTETNYICLLDLQSPESDVTKTTAQPVPIALQLVPTTESSKDISEENEKPTEAEQINIQNTEHNAALETESDIEETDKLAEQIEETQPVGSEHHEEKAAEASEGEVTSMQENVAETPETPESSEVAVVEVSQTADGEATNMSNSPDYPADEPDNENSVSELSEQQQQAENATPEGATNAEQTENMSDTHVEGDEEKKNPEINGGTTVVTDNTDNEGDSEVQIQINNTQGEDVISETDETPIAAETASLSPVTSDQFLSCYSCTSSADTKCAQGPGRPINCLSMGSKQNGCYTLYKADSNITTRGCISELTNEGLKYCKSNAKRCFLCYEKGCNNQLAPSAANQNIGNLSFWLGIGSLVFIKIMID